MLAHGSKGVEVALEKDEKQAQDPSWQSTGPWALGPQAQDSVRWCTGPWFMGLVVSK
jgi:hypothetical protein